MDMIFCGYDEEEVDVPIKTLRNVDFHEERQFVTVSCADSTDDILIVLRTEDATADIWHRVAMLFFRQGYCNDFIRISDEGFKQKSPTHRDGSKLNSVTPIVLSVAFYYSQIGSTMTDVVAGEKCFSRSASWLNCAGKLGIIGYEAEYYVGRAFLYLRRSEYDQADKHFTFILANLDGHYVPALLGRAFLAFSNKDYRLALAYFRRVLELDPENPSNARVGIGHCFWKLGQRGRAKMAFERAVEVQPNDVEALCGLAICYLSTMETDFVQIAVQLLARAYRISSRHPLTLHYLADHYFYRKEFDRCIALALDAFRVSKLDGLRKSSAFIIGRSYQAKNDMKYAMHYFYEALKEPIGGFFLPYFGLAQCYLHLNDIELSCKFLLKILSQEGETNNYLAQKMLGCIYSSSENPEKRWKAQQYLKNVLEVEPGDILSRVALATSEEGLDDVRAHDNYAKALDEYHSKVVAVPPEVYNNYACTLFRLKKYFQAFTFFGLARKALEEMGDLCKQKFIFITIYFNVARTEEALCRYQEAEAKYKEILKKHTSYYSCFIRLALMARDRGYLHESSTYFKEALQFSCDHPDVWIFMGILHLSNQESTSARRKFEIIDSLVLKGECDSYTQVALANVDLFELQESLFNDDAASNIVDYRQIQKQSIAVQQQLVKPLRHYREVLRREPTNIYAANGVGCILALKGLFTEAREVFSQVREAASDFQDVFVNIAHTYFEERMYSNAAQMYELCIKKFVPNTNSEIMQCLAKAHFCNQSFGPATAVLLKCRRIVPYDSGVLFALGRALRKLGRQQIQNKNTDLKEAQTGVRHVHHAHNIFQFLICKRKIPSLSSAAKKEASCCADLLKQTPHLIKRVEEAFNEEQKLKHKRDNEMKAFKEQQIQQKIRNDLLKQKETEDVHQRRQAVKKKTEIVRQSWEASETQSTKKKSRKGLASCVESDVDDFVEDEESNTAASKPQVKSMKLLLKVKTSYPVECTPPRNPRKKRRSKKKPMEENQSPATKAYSRLKSTGKGSTLVENEKNKEANEPTCVINNLYDENEMSYDAINVNRIVEDSISSILDKHNNSERAYQTVTVIASNNDEPPVLEAYYDIPIQVLDNEDCSPPTLSKCD